MSICNFDDTLPLPDEVDREFRDNAGDDLTALAWLAENDIDPAPILEHVGRIALIQYGMIWNPETGRYRFLIHAPGHVGPKHLPELAVPIIEDGTFVDMLFISNDGTSFARATCRASWLGREYLTSQLGDLVKSPKTPKKPNKISVRLHAHPMDWLAAGCTGVCHIEPVSRKALKDLRAVKTILCNDIHTALEAWDWGFGADDDNLARFSIDDSPGNISAYYEDDFKWRTASKEARYGS